MLRTKQNKSIERQIENTEIALKKSGVHQNGLRLFLHQQKKQDLNILRKKNFDLKFCCKLNDTSNGKVFEKYLKDIASPKEYLPCSVFARSYGSIWSNKKRKYANRNEKKGRVIRGFPKVTIVLVKEEAT